MFYTSTRDKSVKLTASQAILKGISDEGGLLVPAQLSHITLEKIAEMAKLSYIERAKIILSEFLTDFTPEELDSCLAGAYEKSKFSSEAIAPTVHIDGSKNILELWHGPTCAFKDMALQLLPYLMSVSAKKAAAGRQIVILVATSGDTGKAALEGFKNVENTKILVFYPENGVSPTQKLQMLTQEGDNVYVSAVKGNFDDAQSAVKEIFTNSTVKAALNSAGMMFSSANSINWGRLVPQIVYYFSSYCDLINMNEIKLGDKVNFTVPTGNFGNILAAFYAKQMGLPVNRLICASNSNNVLTDFINGGTYNKNRQFYTTTSPSMDILISSNLERLLYHLSNEDENTIKNLMQSLAENGTYTVSDDLLKNVSKFFDAGWADEAGIFATIKKHFESYGYLLDTHTAAAVKVYDDYVKKTGDLTPTVIDSTASPYKFSKDVLSAVLGSEYTGSDAQEELFRLSQMPVPAPITALKGKKVRFSNVCTKEDMPSFVKKCLE
ncbi:MAG: threonine synthase [Clostridiales bacterium]|nr:threonine synthase [Clostridiales bacterium]